jgi:hypothetical protein
MLLGPVRQIQPHGPLDTGHTVWLFHRNRSSSPVGTPSCGCAENSFLFIDLRVGRIDESHLDVDEFGLSHRPVLPQPVGRWAPRVFEALS